MSKRDWKVFVEDMLESIGYIEAFLEGIQYDDFRLDRKTVDAVVRNFEIIGEASKFIPEEIKKRCPDVDWAGIVGLRNRIAHEYFAISPAIIWQIIKEELPRLKEEMQHLLEEEKA